jgi:hypothetical protein
MDHHASVEIVYNVAEYQQKKRKAKTILKKEQRTLCKTALLFKELYDEEVHTGKA